MLLLSGIAALAMGSLPNCDLVPVFWAVTVPFGTADVDTGWSSRTGWGWSGLTGRRALPEGFTKGRGSRERIR